MYIVKSQHQPVCMDYGMWMLELHDRKQWPSFVIGVDWGWATFAYYAYTDSIKRLTAHLISLTNLSPYQLLKSQCTWQVFWLHCTGTMSLDYITHRTHNTSFRSPTSHTWHRRTKNMDHIEPQAITRCNMNSLDPAVNSHHSQAKASYHLNLINSYTQQSLLIISQSVGDLH